MGLLGDVKKFFSKSTRKQKEKIDKLETLIEMLVLKADYLMLRHGKEPSEEKQERLLKEHNAVKKLLQKSRIRLEELRREAEKEA